MAANGRSITRFGRERTTSRPMSKFPQSVIHSPNHVCQVKSSKGCFAKKHPKGVDQITTQREMQAGLV